jgi:peptide/nickel transport system substrate-binding protein
MEAPDPQTVVYHLRDTFAFFPAVTASPAFIPVNPKDFRVEAINRFPEKLDGVGRYRMVSHVPGERMVLQLNERCGLEGRPSIRTVQIRYFPDSKALADALANAEVDIAWRKLEKAEAERLKLLPKINVMTIRTPLLRYLAFNNAYRKNSN